MDEYIKRSDVLCRIEGKRQSLQAMVNINYAQAVRDVYGVVCTIPVADVAPVKHGKRGKWLKNRNERMCSICKFIYYNSNDDFTFCPNCGTRMDVKEVGEK